MYVCIHTHIYYIFEGSASAAGPSTWPSAGCDKKFWYCALLIHMWNVLRLLRLCQAKSVKSVSIKTSRREIRSMNKGRMRHNKIPPAMNLSAPWHSLRGPSHCARCRSLPSIMHT